MNKKIFGLGKNLIKHELISGSIFVFLGVIVSSFFSFLLAQSLTTVVVRFATEFFVKDKFEEAKDLYTRLLRFVFILTLLIFFGFAVFSLPLKNISNYAFPAAIAILALNSFISADVILVKHFFNAQDAGLYGGLSLVGKVIFYFTGPISSVMFPLLIKRPSSGQNFNSLFYLSLFLVTIPSILIVIFYYVFPLYSINFFLGGHEYEKVSPYLGTYGLFTMVFSILNIFVNFFLSIKKTKIFFVVGLGALFQMILISFFHNSFSQVINASLLSSSAILAVLFVIYIKEYGNLKKIKNIIPFTSYS